MRSHLFVERAKRAVHILRWGQRRKWRRGRMWKSSEAPWIIQSLSRASSVSRSWFLPNLGAEKLFMPHLLCTRSVVPLLHRPQRSRSLRTSHSL